MVPDGPAALQVAPGPKVLGGPAIPWNPLDLHRHPSQPLESKPGALRCIHMWPLN